MRTFDVQPDFHKLLDPPTCKVCGDPHSTHEHDRSGTDCAQCPAHITERRQRVPST